jgi:hypothetical protein
MGCTIEGVVANEGVVSSEVGNEGVEGVISGTKKSHPRSILLI